MNFDEEVNEFVLRIYARTVYSAMLSKLSFTSKIKKEYTSRLTSEKGYKPYGR